MGTSKTSLFGQNQNDIALVAKALSHPARIAIVMYLLECKSCINKSLVDELGLAQATISQHLQALKDAGLIQGSIDGVKTNYCLDPKRWAWAKSAFDSLFQDLAPNRPNDCC
ncbi:MAG: winged helix-turn-helix transcriptional regulator [Bacteroidetes bacterium]|nr:winged helix-turn-helix transcriptional regulator [Bacteroidota bacterium]